MQQRQFYNPLPLLSRVKLSKLGIESQAMNSGLDRNKGVNNCEIVSAKKPSQKQTNLLTRINLAISNWYRYLYFQNLYQTDTDTNMISYYPILITIFSIGIHYIVLTDYRSNPTPKNTIQACNGHLKFQSYEKVLCVIVHILALKQSLKTTDKLPTFKLIVH